MSAQAPVPTQPPGPATPARVGEIGAVVAPPAFDPLVHVATARALFWQNCMRDMLTSLSIESARERADALRAAHEATATGKPIPERETAFDGRMAVVTARGERIPIADVQPMFACSIGGNGRERSLSAEVQCTVFQVRTPGGEVYTLPLSEIVGLHAVTPELMRQLEEANARQTGEGPDQERPFGFAALRSLARSDGRG